MSLRADSWATLPLGALEQIDRLCARFEAAWGSGSAPALVDYLAEAPVVGREVLLRELLRLDREYRGRRGEATSFEHYAGLLPQDAELLRAAWTEVATADGRAGRRFGDFELLRELGRGGMGVVYEARQVSLDRRVALKMIKDSAFVSGDQLLRFQNEARVVATLDHPHIVPILDVGEYEGQHCFSMKLIAGGSPAKRLDADVADPKAAAALLLVVAEAVHHAHQGASSTATSSRPTSSSTSRACPTSPTSGWPSGSTTTAT